MRSALRPAASVLKNPLPSIAGDGVVWLPTGSQVSPGRVAKTWQE